jgi:hypothetical protein
MTHVASDAEPKPSAEPRIEGCLSIDATPNPPDNGFLENVRQQYPKAAKHDEFVQMAGELGRCLFSISNPKFAHVVGHGNEGMVIVHLQSNPKVYLGFWNPSFWGPELRLMLQRATIVRIWACHPGAGESGAEFMYQLALATGKRCMGPTGFLFASPTDIFMEANSTWQVADAHSGRPKPIPAPTEHFVAMYSEFVMETPKGRRSFKLRDVTSIAIYRGGSGSLHLTGGDAVDFLGLIDLQEAISVPGVPAAIVTAEIRITAVDREGEHVVRLRIYNDRLAQDELSGKFYRCSAHLEHVLRTL